MSTSAIATWDPAEFSTQDLAQMLNPGDFVNVDGYGGFAEIQSIYEDGVGPHGHPKYRAIVKWGPNNPNIGRTKHCPIEDFALGRLRPAIMDEQQAADAVDNKIDNMDQAQMLARLAEINAILSQEGC